MRRVRVSRLVSTIGITVFLLALPFLLAETRVNLATEVLVYALFAMSFNLLFGYAGMLPFGHAALFGLGCYCAALISGRFHGMPILLTLSIVALCGLLAGAFIGAFCVRRKGSYSALLSLGFQMFLLAAAIKWRSVTNGVDGLGVARPELHVPALGTISLASAQNLYYFTLVVVALGVAACFLFLKTPLGNSVICTRERDTRASFLGYNVFLTRLAVYSGSGLLAALAGGLFAFFQEFVNTSCLDMMLSLVVALMCVIGGSGRFFGPVLGAAFYVIVQDRLSGLTEYWMILMGVLFIVVILYFKDGIIGLFDAKRLMSRARKTGGG